MTKKKLKWTLKIIQCLCLNLILVYLVILTANQTMIQFAMQGAWVEKNTHLTHQKTISLIIEKTG